ncbi:MAG TPA: hypothetical protein VNS63_21325 [Blastocatellia bacterium]|nr:hypothetical protein [Blastocatellia bacterium]
MNQNWQDKEIRQLYREQRQADESIAPHFAATLEAALSKKRADRFGRPMLRLAVAFAALVAVASFVFLLLGRSSPEQPPIVSVGPGESGDKPAITSSEPSSVPTSPAPKPARRVRTRRQSPERAAALLSPLISQWQSPTGFLLKTPGDELLRTVPRIGESAVEIKMNLSSTKN